MDTAQKALEFIKKNNLGIATFIALDKMESYARKAESKVDTPPNSHRLYDLIKQRDGTRYSGAFYYALRDTLVAPNTDLAKKIAYGKTKRWRVVTLDGVMIDISGTMAGGGNSVIKGLMSKVTCDIDPKEVDKMSDEINSDQRRLEEIGGNKTKLEHEVRGLLKTLSADKFTKQKSEQAIKSYMKQQSSLQKEIPILEDQLKAIVPDENKIDEIQKKINGHQSKLDEVSLKAQKKDDLIKKCDKDLKDLHNKKLKPHQDSAKKTETEIDSVHDQMTKIKVALKGLTRNKEKLEKSISDIETELSEAQSHTEALKTEFQKIEEQAEVVVEKDNMCQEKMKEQAAKMEGLKAELAGLESSLEAHEQKTVDFRHAIDKYDGVIKENGSKIRHWKKEMSKHALQNIPGEADLEPLKTLEAEELENIDAKGLEYEIAVLEEALKQKQPNMAVIKEYLLKHAAWEDKVAELNQITSARDTARDEHERLRKKRLSEFMAGFLVITNKLKEMYQMITLGGDAELELVDTLDPFSEGIVFSVRPPKKSWKNISNLSGGEKTLSSLALVFALHHYKPSPLYVMDEIDAALDFKNVSIVAHYIKERTKNAQFIIISLRNNMFELGDHLIGIYKTENATKSVTINPNTIAV